jgi:hypothetical protein
MGGGHHWQHGNSLIFNQARSKIEGKQGIIVTEDQNEVYIGDVDVFLTLFGFRRADFPFISNKTEDR